MRMTAASASRSSTSVASRRRGRFFFELRALRRVFSGYWSDVDYERVRIVRQTP